MEGFDVAQRLGARALVLLEADVVSIIPEWLERLAGPVLDGKADFVAPAYARHRWEGTISRLLLSPLVRALYGRRLQQPFGGQQALSARLVEHLLIHPKWSWQRADVSDLWITGTAIADGFAVSEAWLGRHLVRSRTRTSDLPAMIAQTLGATFTVMERHGDLWLEVRGSEPIPMIGEPAPLGAEPMTVDVAGMLEAFRLGMRDLTSIWELILAPETLADVLTLDDGIAFDGLFDHSGAARRDRSFGRRLVRRDPLVIVNHVRPPRCEAAADRPGSAIDPVAGICLSRRFQLTGSARLSGGIGRATGGLRLSAGPAPRVGAGPALRCRSIRRGSRRVARGSTAGGSGVQRSPGRPRSTRRMPGAGSPARRTAGTGPPG